MHTDCVTQAVRLRRRAALAHVLKRARGFSLLSQSDLAARLGVSTRTIAGYEAGETDQSATIVLEWLRVCGRPLDDLSAAWSELGDDEASSQSRWTTRWPFGPHDNDDLGHLPMAPMGHPAQLLAGTAR